MVVSQLITANKENGLFNGILGTWD